MKKLTLSIVTLILVFMSTQAQTISKDIITANDGKQIEFNFIKHASIYFVYDDCVFYLDPVKYQGYDYSQMPKADFIFITHDHYDHLDIDVVKEISKSTTTIIANEFVVKQLGYGIALKNWVRDDFSCNNFKFNVFAVPAYNTTEGRDQFHPQGRDNGYIVTIGGTVIYLPGDCETMEEMNKFGKIDIAFLPVNQPYTMTIEQAIQAVLILMPTIVYPFHYGETDLEVFEEKVKSIGVEVKIFPM